MYGPQWEPRMWDQRGVKPEFAALARAFPRKVRHGIAPGDLLTFFLNSDNDLALCFSWNAKGHDICRGLEQHLFQWKKKPACWRRACKVEAQEREHPCSKDTSQVITNEANERFTKSHHVAHTLQEHNEKSLTSDFLFLSGSYHCKHMQPCNCQIFYKKNGQWNKHFLLKYSKSLCGICLRSVVNKKIFQEPETISCNSK